MPEHHPLKLFTVPNFITCGNVICGAVGVHFASQGKLDLAFYLICIGALLDFLDGAVTRLLKAHSLSGKQLDSLADMLTFGFLPSYMIFQILNQQDRSSYWPFLAFLIAVFSALRLAKFNVDLRQSKNFIGLPTPANALFFGSLCLSRDLFEVVHHSSELLIGIILLFSYLLIAEIPLLSLKFQGFSWRKNYARYILVLCATLLIVIFHLEAIPLTILLYLLLSFTLTPKQK